MKKDTMKVGTSKGDFYVTVEIDVPETLADCKTLAKDSEQYLVAKFHRGYRIDLQEGGARQTVVEMLAGKSPAAAMKDAEFVKAVTKSVAEEIKAFDPKAPRSRGGRPKVMPSVTLKQGKKTYTAAELQALLAASGIKVLADA